jgi:hypothetical protein
VGAASGPLRSARSTSICCAIGETSCGLRQSPCTRPASPGGLPRKKTQAEAEYHQRDRYIGDPWDKAIAEYVETASEVTMDEVLRFAVKLEIGRCGQSEMNRAARCLRSLGLSRVQVRTGDKRVYKYRKPVSEEGQTENVTPLKLVTVNDR